jgi:putative aldouronate transport system substrate-binding protein
MAILLVIAIVFSACGGGGSSSDASAPASSQAPASSAADSSTAPADSGVEGISGVNEFPIVAETVDMKIAVRYYSYVTDYEDNDMTRWMEDHTNVHIVWDILPEKEYLEKVNLIMSSGTNLPDVFMRCGFNNEMQVTFGSQGLIIPLEGLIEKWQYNFKELTDTYPTIIPQITAPDGHIYAIPGYGRNEANSLAQRFWINKTFMDALGITKVPETTDELYDYLVAVRDGDPNGNGKKDEIPLVGDIESWYGNVDGYLMEPFIYNDTKNQSENVNGRRRIYLTEEGKVEPSFNKPEWKAGLEYMRKLCAEGLLAPESFTLDKVGVRALCEFEDALLVGSITNGGVHNFTEPNGERRKNYISIPPLAGPDGTRQAYWEKYLGPDIGKYVITKDCKIPDIAMKWADACFTEEFWMMGRYGVEGRDWVRPPEGTIAVDGGQARVEEILKWGTPTNAYWASSQPTWSRFESYARALSDDPFELEYVLWSAKNVYEPFRQENVVPPIFYTYDESRRYAELNKLIIEYVEQSIARFVTGDMSLETDWESYLSTLESMGLEELMTLTQTGFDRQWAETLGYK